MILFIWVALLISAVGVGVHAAVLAVSPDARRQRDLDRSRTLSRSTRGTRALRESEEQDGDW